jgi:DHA2 family multidrug resistance protein
LFSSSTFLINIFLQHVYQYTPTQVGLLLFPQGVVYGIGSLWAGRLSDYLDPRLPLLLGLISFAVVYFWLGGISAVATSTVIMAMLCLRSFSFSCVNSPNTLMTLRALPEDKMGMGTGLFSVSRGIAGTLSVALTASLLEQQRAVHAIELAQQQGLLTFPAEWAIVQLQQIFTGTGDTVGIAEVKAAAQLHQLMIAEASVKAYQDIFMLSGFISLFNILPAFLRSRKSPSATPAQPLAPASVTERASAAPRHA